MEKVVSSFTVFFEDPFWVGVYERECGGKITACKITFGPEPKDYTVSEYFQKHGDELRFSPAVDARGGGRPRGTAVNPKRLQRQIRRQLQASGTGTKAQQALALQREEGKLEGKKTARKNREQEQERRFQMKQEKKKQKHKGR
ncbi:YjdF family protein [Bacilliculturomica massiliensis]|uniref:YjdF family protein n=1 Tax=Bacilliculturomica massiliensis TaxID=1917867 RepID=UPI00102F7D8B|nr:YjdF family protein [Bacilliculturomica massiliensis]